MKINALSSVSYPLWNKKNEAAKPASNNNMPAKEKTEISNVYYKPLSFQRSLKEHKSWGAQVDPSDKGVTFKVLVYPDTKSVNVLVKKAQNPQKQELFELKNTGGGVFQTESKIPASKIQTGDIYSYVIENPDGKTETVKDPCSYKQEKLMGESIIYDHKDYIWHDDDWQKGKNKHRISRLANLENGLVPQECARIAEIHIGTMTNEGTFEAAKSQLKTLSDVGFNAIEIMPCENTYSFNWGYDGADKYAPAAYLGGPDKLKELIDYAHSLNLTVIMDVVYNHAAPDGSSFAKTGPYLKGPNSFGDAFNYEGENSKYVRDFAVNSALNWVNNYHCDGLRFDMTKYFESDTLMQQIAAELHTHNPDVFLIAEDARSKIAVFGDNFWDDYFEPHDRRVINPLKPEETGEGMDEGYHIRAIENIENNNVPLSRLGFDSEWDFNFFHVLKDLLYGSADIENFEKACFCSQKRVKYVTSHDEIGNYDGSRFVSKLMVNTLKLNDKITVNDEDISRAHEYSKLKNCSFDEALGIVKSQKAQFTAEKLARLYQTGGLDEYINNSDVEHFNKDVLEPLDILPKTITAQGVKDSFNDSYNTLKTAFATTYSIPGPKMVFQGDENLDLTPFRFFRQFESIKNEDYLYTEKGYKPAMPAYMESKIGNIEYSKEGSKRMDDFRRLISDLNKLSLSDPALSEGSMVLQNNVKHPISKVIGLNIKNFQTGDEIFTVSNFANDSYGTDEIAKYGIKFPEGVWIEILNTDDKKYNGSGLVNNGSIYSAGNTNSEINLAQKSCAIFKKIK